MLNKVKNGAKWLWDHVPMKDQEWAVDSGERVLNTFWQALLAGLLASMATGGGLSVTAIRAVLIGAIGAGLALGKTLIAGFFQNTLSAASLAPGVWHNITEYLHAPASLGDQMASTMTSSVNVNLNFPNHEVTIKPHKPSPRKE